MADTNKVSLAHLKMAMNTIKEYHDQNEANFSLAYDANTGILKLMHGEQEISSVTISSTASSPVPCTGITLNTNTLSFTSTNVQTITATKQPSNTTDVVTWSVAPAGIATVDGGVVTPVANGNCTITATCGSQTATCNVTVSGLNEVTESTIYQLPRETVFNGSNIYIETEIALFGDEYLNTDWTMLLDFTDNGSPTQASIAHCVDELSPYPGLSVKAYNGNMIASIYGKVVTLGSQDTNRHKFVITKSGNTFTFYNESMTQLGAKTFDSLATVTQTLLLGCMENTTGYKGPYVKGTLHRLKIVQGVMSREDCLAWINLE